MVLNEDHDLPGCKKNIFGSYLYAFIISWKRGVELSKTENIKLSVYQFLQKCNPEEKVIKPVGIINHSVLDLKHITFWYKK